jgi:putative transposase
VKAKRFSAEHIAGILKQAELGTPWLPKRIACDNGSEFAGGQMDLWAYANNVTLDFSRRGKPTDNAIVESFNGRFREECLNTHWSESIEDAKEKIDRDGIIMSFDLTFLSRVLPPENTY